MKYKGIKIGLVVFLSIVVIIAGVWYLMDGRRAQIARSYIEKGQTLEESGDLKSAYLSYKKAQAATPRSFAPYYHQGLVLKKVGQEEKALTALEAATKYTGKDMAPYFAYAKANYEAKNYFQAEKYFQRCLAFEPTNADIYFWLGKAQMNQNRLEDAQRSFRLALEIFPASQYHLYLGVSLAYNDLEGAKEELEKYDEENKLSLSELKTAQVQGVNNQNFKDTQEAFKRMISSESPLTKELILGQLLNQVGETGLAVARLKDITEEYPDIRDGWVFLGYGQYKEGEYEKAINSLKKAKELDPIHSLTYELMAKAYEATGDQNASRQMLIKANSLKEG